MEDFDFGYHHPHFDGQSASAALRQLLDRVFTWRNELAASIAEPDVKAVSPEYENELHVDKCHAFAYQDVACCNAAVGSIAPCFEGLFFHEFAELRSLFGDSQPINDYHRWKLSPDDFWVPSIVSEKGTKRDVPDIMRGFKQLITSLELAAYFPDGMYDTLNALFRFRNFALHQGYEWPRDARARFAQLIDTEKWGDWFSVATWGDELWMFYTKDAFVTASLDLFDNLLAAFHEIHNTWHRPQT